MSARQGEARPMRRNASTRPVVVLMLCGAFLIALVVGTIALILSNLRHHAIAESKQQLLATATVLAKQAARDFQAVELVEANLIEQMETLAIVSRRGLCPRHGRPRHPPDAGREDQRLPDIEAVMLVGADGKLINSSLAWPKSSVDVGARIISRP